MINTETQQCWRCREQKTIGHSFISKQNTYTATTPFQRKKIFSEEGLEDCNGQGLLGWLTRKQHLLDTARQLSKWTHSSSVTACTRHGQAQPDHIPARTEEVDIKLHPSPRSDWQPLASGRGRVRFFFFLECILQYVNHAPVGGHTSKIVPGGQSGLDGEK